MFGWPIRVFYGVYIYTNYNKTLYTCHVTLSNRLQKPLFDGWNKFSRNNVSHHVIDEFHLDWIVLWERLYITLDTTILSISTTLFLKCKGSRIIRKTNNNAFSTLLVFLYNTHLMQIIKRGLQGDSLPIIHPRGSSDSFTFIFPLHS